MTTEDHGSGLFVPYARIPRVHMGLDANGSERTVHIIGLRWPARDAIRDHETINQNPS
jgi:hypothetical protein